MSIKNYNKAYFEQPIVSARISPLSSSQSILLQNIKFLFSLEFYQTIYSNYLYKHDFFPKNLLFPSLSFPEHRFFLDFHLTI